MPISSKFPLPSGFPSITLYAFLFSPTCATCFTNLTLLDWITWIMEMRKANNNRHNGKTPESYLIFAQCQIYMQQIRPPERISSTLYLNTEYLNIINSSLHIHKSTFMTGPWQQRTDIGKYFFVTRTTKL